MTEHEFDAWLLNNIKLATEEQVIIRQKMRKTNKRIAVKMVALPVVAVSAVVVWKYALRKATDQNDTEE